MKKIVYIMISIVLFLLLAGCQARPDLHLSLDPEEYEQIIIQKGDSLDRATLQDEALKAEVTRLLNAFSPSREEKNGDYDAGNRYIIHFQKPFEKSTVDSLRPETPGPTFRFTADALMTFESWEPVIEYPLYEGEPGYFEPLIQIFLENLPQDNES